MLDAKMDWEATSRLQNVVEAAGREVCISAGLANVFHWPMACLITP